MRLLLVEDYAPLRKSISRGLRDQGWAVDASGDGEEGLWYARGHGYDVIILDLMLPKLDGLAVLEALRREGHASPVLILTARDRVEDRVAGLDRGADDYLVKPFAFDELLARIRALVRRRYGDARPLIALGAMSIDPARGSVTFEGEEMSLTAREYTLLEYLARRAGQVVSREDIWTNLYDEHAELGSNVIDVYVGYLRKKLQRDGAPRIKTIRGRGYRLEIPDA